MDVFLTTVLAGVIVTLVGAIAAFYFGGVRERQRQHYERNQEAQNQRNERQRELNARRTKALDEMRTQCQLIVEAYESWTTRAMHLEEALSSLGFADKLVEPIPRVVQELGRQGDDVLQNMAFLEGLYKAHKPYLEPSTRSVFEAFQKEFHEWHSLLLGKLRSIAIKLEEVVSGERSGAIARMFPVFPFSKLPRSLQRQAQSDVQEVVEAAKLARVWDYEAHLRALETEAERVAGTHS